jgi:hypothetical protein
MIPAALKRSPVFLLDNPIALRKDNVELVVKGKEQAALHTLVELFNWLDDLKPQQATDIVSFYEKYQSIEAKLDQRAREVEIDRLITRFQTHSAVSVSPYCLHLVLGSYARWM